VRDDQPLLVPFTFRFCREVTMVVDHERHTAPSKDTSPSPREKKRKSIKKIKKEKKRKKERGEKDEAKREKKKRREEKRPVSGDDDGSGKRAEVSTAENGTAPAKARNEKYKKSETREDERAVNDSGASSDNATIRPMVESSALDFVEPPAPCMAAAPTRKKEPSSAATSKLPRDDHNITLLLFYQYVEPVWTVPRYNLVKHELADLANAAGVTGRMRVAREGLNCTLTGTAGSIRDFCDRLREYDPVFRQTEFKLTHDLPDKQRFRELKLIPVLELVHYGLEGDKAPPIHKYHGTHLEPKEYHAKLADKETVVIDVRNHYEAVIGRFDPPNSKWLDPKMRKSTSFPVWLDDPNTKKELANKQVLMVRLRCPPFVKRSRRREAIVGLL
jgi:UPF0176 acylphosphatase like domain